MRRPLVVSLLTFVAASAAAAEPPARPELRILRYEEDWSRLEARDDAFDALKNRGLGGGWWLTSGGSLRLRFESDENRTLGASPEHEDSLLKARTYLDVEIRHEHDFRFFAEARAADLVGSDRPKPLLDHDQPDFQNFFVEGTFGSRGTHPVTIRAGRQELALGAERLVSPLDWSGTRRTFDGLSVIAVTPASRLHAFATQPVDHEPTRFDSPVDRRWLSGVDWQRRFGKAHLLEPYLLWLEDGGGRAVSETTGAKGDVTRRTWGLRYQYDRDGWLGETEVSYQEGSSAGDSIEAWSVSATGGHAWANAPWKPRLSAGIDVATGDADPADGRVDRFDQLYPLGHAYLGHIDLEARQNVRAARVQVDLAPRKDVNLTVTLHQFALDEERDALFNSAGGVVRRDPTGNSGRDVATELDAYASWKIGRHHRVSAEICRWWSGDYIAKTGDGSDAWFVWTAWELRF